MIKIFLENVATFDFAFLSESHLPVGKSFFVSITIEGEKKSNGMVIDFSDAKELLKFSLAEFDHKLLVSDTDIKYQDNQYVVVNKNIHSAKNHLDNNDANSLENFFAIRVKSTWIKIISYEILTSISKNNLDLFEKYLSEILFPLMPKNIKSVSVKLNLNYQNVFAEQAFNYTHTICTHKGYCQRFHGHSAKIGVFLNNTLNTTMTTKFAQKINGSYLVSKKHICGIDSMNEFQQMVFNTIKSKNIPDLANQIYAIYYAGTDGDVAILIAKKFAILLDDESTIENIAQYIYDDIILDLEQSTNLPYKRAHSLDEQSIKVCVYEGLTKGAMIE